MRPRSPFSLGRRSAAVAVATAVIAVPFLAAAPASAVTPAPIVSVTFDDTELMYGEETQGYFNGQAGLAQIDDVDVCTFEYRNGTAYQSSTEPSQTAFIPNQGYSFLTSSSFVEGDVYTIAFDSPVDNGDGTFGCAVPALSAPGLVQASLTLVAAPVVPDIPLTAGPVALTQGVPFDQVITYTGGESFDFSARGGFAGGGPQSSAGLENGEINPLAGLRFESLDEDKAGVAPRIRLVGTPSYSGTVATGIFVGDYSKVGSAELVLNIAAPAQPLTIAVAKGQPVAGAPVTVFASGLQAGAAYSVTVRSTPIVIGSGVVLANGQIATTVNLPAGLAAGSHSITLVSTAANGAAYSSVLYFTVSASGTLLAISNTAPARLAATGVDLMVPSLIAGGLLVAGLALAGTSAYRRRSN
jgi:hypothetical protein